MKLTALSTTDPLRRPCLGRQHRLVECYVFVDNYLQDHPGMAAWRRSNNDDPEFTDAEVLTIALTGGYFQTDSAQTDLPACLEERAGGVPGAGRLQAVDSSADGAGRSGWAVGPCCSPEGRGHEPKEALRGRFAADSAL